MALAGLLRLEPPRDALASCTRSPVLIEVGPSGAVHVRFARLAEVADSLPPAAVVLPLVLPPVPFALPLPPVLLDWPVPRARHVVLGRPTVILHHFAAVDLHPLLSLIPIELLAMLDLPEMRAAPGDVDRPLMAPADRRRVVVHGRAQGVHIAVGPPLASADLPARVDRAVGRVRAGLTRQPAVALDAVVRAISSCFRAEGLVARDAIVAAAPPAVSGVGLLAVRLAHRGVGRALGLL
mmetsp:Transcript_37828/g.102374  ORF Transcript_37828/g.102374 Transcript_37828/m.102374 type:complete len:238 (+) Transcript_37828:219-932(+)